MIGINIKLPKDEQLLRDATRLIMMDSLMNLKESLDDELSNRGINIDAANSWDGMELMHQVIDEELHEMAKKLDGIQAKLEAKLKLPIIKR